MAAKPPRKTATKTATASILTDAEVHLHDVEHPVPATIVADNRDTRPKRVIQVVLGIVIVALVGRVVQFEINRAAASVKAEQERATLITAQAELADALHTIAGNVTDDGTILQRYGHDLRALRRVIQQQNTDLIAAGLVPVHIPRLGNQDGGGGAPAGSPSTPRSHPTGSAPPPSPHPSSHPSPHPSGHPTHAPPTPHPVQTTICHLPIIGAIACELVNQNAAVAMVVWLTSGID